MRFILSVPLCLAVCACASHSPSSGLPANPPAIVSEDATISQNVPGNYPLMAPVLYTPPQTATLVPICEKFASSLSVAEQRTDPANGGYQIHQM